MITEDTEVVSNETVSEVELLSITTAVIVQPYALPLISVEFNACMAFGKLFNLRELINAEIEKHYKNNMINTGVFGATFEAFKERFTLKSIGSRELELRGFRLYSEGLTQPSETDVSVASYPFTQAPHAYSNGYQVRTLSAQWPLSFYIDLDTSNGFSGCTYNADRNMGIEGVWFLHGFINYTNLEKN